jgi:hypothetical protein
MKESCQFCEIDTSGNHQRTCPLYPNHKSPFKQFIQYMGDVGNKDILKLESDDAFIERFASLISTYYFVLDIIDDTEDELQHKKLAVVADFIKNALDKCINEMVLLQELRNNGIKE